MIQIVEMLAAKEGFDCIIYALDREADGGCGDTAFQRSVSFLLSYGPGRRVSRSSAPPSPLSWAHMLIQLQHHQAGPGQGQGSARAGVYHLRAVHPEVYPDQHLVPRQAPQQVAMASAMRARSPPGRLPFLSVMPAFLAVPMRVPCSSPLSAC